MFNMSDASDQIDMFRNRRGMSGALAAVGSFLTGWLVSFIILLIVMHTNWPDVDGKWKWAIGLGAGIGVVCGIIAYFVVSRNVDTIGRTVAMGVAGPGAGLAYDAATAIDSSMGDTAFQ